ncbi:YdcH family protein [Parasphingopyxis marina]|uniref:YdcH family protein n=1 Tax=Parasphingopyxis marina TaxID=2761622 RepID=A0A842HZ73_9SPHN|nr:YdcH family protein [Parasphingopyxis marina]MBC2778155.1 YdcH family protein [Parasphingopyxis marina]
MENAHETALAAKHAGLDKKIEAELQRPSPDQIRLADLKKQKLRIKEQLGAH